MYQRARKLLDLVGDSAMFEKLAETVIEAYLISINALALLDPKNAWLTMPVTDDGTRQVIQNPHWLSSPLTRSRPVNDEK